MSGGGRRAGAALLALLTGWAASAGAQAGGAERCAAGTERDAVAWLTRAERAATGGSATPSEGSAPLRLRVVTAVSQSFQSDRSYPPFLYSFERGELWYDPATGVERVSGTSVDPFGERPMGERLADARSTYYARGDSMMAIPPAHRFTLQGRPLNAWAVVRDWRTAGDATVRGTCRYRDYPRLVLVRSGPFGEERLYLDPKTALPVRLTRREPNLLWGTVAVEYVYSNWVNVGAGTFPMASFRLVDGDEEAIRTAAPLRVTADSIPRLALPSGAPDMLPAVAAALPDARPDTVRIGANAFLLRTRAYTNAVVLARDTVYILDAQTGEDRARADSAWIGRLFPGRHPFVLIVSDLAWPHIAGVRYWVANGATVVSHEASRRFLQRVVARRWTDAPDLLERRRAHTAFRFRGIDTTTTLAGGALQLIPIDGIGSEGSVMTWLPGETLLFAGDYVQRVDRPTAYAREVYDATVRAGLRPDRVAAMHLPVTPWAKLVELFTHDSSTSR